MKTTLQKMICLSICVAMLLVLFAGCWKEPVSSPTDVTPQIESHFFYITI